MPPTSTPMRQGGFGIVYADFFSVMIEPLWLKAGEAIRQIIGRNTGLIGAKRGAKAKILDG